MKSLHLVLQRALRPLALRIKHLLVYGQLVLVDNSKGMQEIQATLLRGEVRDQIPRVEQYGLTSVPHAGAEALIASIGGLREQPLAIAVGTGGTG